MTTMDTGLTPVELLHIRAADILPDIAAGASDRERHHHLPHDEVRRLARAQLLTFRIPADHGGPGSSVRDATRFVIDLAAADSNIAQVVRSHLGFVEGLLAYGSPEEHERWYSRLLAGDVYGNAGWEIGGANGAVSTRIVADGDRYTANGSKYYSTGALYADWIGTSALDPQGSAVSFVLPRDRAGLHLLDDFDAMGQRLTASGTTNLDNVTVYPHEIRHRTVRDHRSPVTAFLQLYLGAVEAGIARAALDDAVLFTRQHARPIAHSTAKRSVDDPYVRETVGEIAALAYAAEAVVLHAAADLDRAWRCGLEPALVTEAAVASAKAQIVAIGNALKAAELLFDVGGGSATARKHNLDRHWRNARTVANHHPRRWKAAVAGAYLLDDVEPPTSGLF